MVFIIYDIIYVVTDEDSKYRQNTNYSFFFYLLIELILMGLYGIYRMYLFYNFTTNTLRKYKTVSSNEKYNEEALVSVINNEYPELENPSPPPVPVEKERKNHKKKAKKTLSNPSSSSSEEDLIKKVNQEQGKAISKENEEQIKKESLINKDLTNQIDEAIISRRIYELKKIQEQE